mmetsp:Transcript_48720/g.114375  ORF Transcript_48720/g.114375 Transcript_48720/m.114375 type:complete len:242 (-) Transcript_48720:1467-2192(-)
MVSLGLIHAAHTNILVVVAVVPAPRKMAAGTEGALSSSATNVVKPDAARIGAKAVASAEVLLLITCTVAQLTAGNAGIGVGEPVVADGTPLIGVPDLEAAVPSPAVGEADVSASVTAVEASRVGAAHAHILGVTAVVATPTLVAARPDVALPPCAAHVVEPDAARVVAEAVASTKVLHMGPAGVSKLATGDGSVGVREAVVAHGTPVSGVVHLETAAAAPTVCKAGAVAHASDRGSPAHTV